ncbi:MAG TPA: RNA methyltransferase PUA domain-containing protein, partial [Agromyces sp.]|nr:RNA methyltransferase PUA domain-containing protein [Agromyces sp.]
MSHLYLDESLELARLAPGVTLTLSGDEARHAVTVARVRVGERIAIGDGRGVLVHGTVASTGQRELTLEAEEIVVVEAPSPRLVLVQALAKGDRDELAVQAATELGVDGVIPWAAARS